MTEQPILITSITATEDLVKNTCVGFNGQKLIANQPCLGIVSADTAQGEECPVMVNGIAIVKTDDAVNQDNFVKSGNNSGVVSAGGTPTFSNILIGIALDSAAGAGELIRVLLK